MTRTPVLLESSKRGFDFILKQMNKQTGYIGRARCNTSAFSTLALAEAYGRVGDDRLGRRSKRR